MNLLFAYPVFLPTSSGSGDVPMEIIWAILIVVNAIWLISFVVAKIHNYIINKGEKSFKYRLMDREYFFAISLFSIVIDIIYAFFGLVIWVSILF